MSEPKVFGDQNITFVVASNGTINLYAGQNQIGFISRVVLDTKQPFVFEVYFPRGASPDVELQIESYARALSMFPMVRIVRE